jgi:general secretion pathway protein F/type IV pilus assembly protein PilC
MPDFTYIARDSTGNKVTGTIDAATRREALSELAGQALFPVDVRGATGGAGRRRIGRVSKRLLANVYAQLADLIKSGVPLLRALEVVQQQSSNAALKSVLGEVHRRVEDGDTLAEAMRHFPRVFGEMALSMIRAGGEGGFLEEALTRVAEFTVAQDDIAKRTVGALVYPLVLITFGTAVVIVLMVFFVPKFDSLFAGLRQRGELPMPTEWLMATSGVMRQWGLWVLAGLAIAAWFARQWLFSAEGRMWRDQLKLRLPLVGGIFQSFAVARFCRVLGTLLRNGVPILRSLEISGEAAGNRVLSEAIHSASENISAGQRLARPLADCGHFPPDVVEMISVAEESNTLESVLLHAADSLERNTWRKLDLAVRLLEPLMLLLLAGVVLMLVIALLLPLVKMSTTIGGY